MTGNDRVYVITRGRPGGIGPFVLDTIVGMDIRKFGVAEEILNACAKRLAEAGTDCVHLYFCEDRDCEDHNHAVMIEKGETLRTLKGKLFQMRVQGLFRVLGHSS